MASTRRAAQAAEDAVIRVSNGILVVVGLEMLAGVLAATSNTEGALGAVLLGAIYALPLAGVALLLRSTQPTLRVGGGVLGGLFALVYVAMPVLNSIGGGAYTDSELVRSILVTVPAAIAGLAALWITVLRPPRRSIRRPKQG